MDLWSSLKLISSQASKLLFCDSSDIEPKQRPSRFQTRTRFAAAQFSLQNTYLSRILPYVPKLCTHTPRCLFALSSFSSWCQSRSLSGSISNKKILGFTGGQEIIEQPIVSARENLLRNIEAWLFCLAHQRVTTMLPWLSLQMEERRRERKRARRETLKGVAERRAVPVTRTGPRQHRERTPAWRARTLAMEARGWSHIAKCFTVV